MSTFSSWKNGRNRICSDDSKVKKSPYVNAGFTYFGRSLSPYNIAKKIHGSSRFDLTNNFVFFVRIIWTPSFPKKLNVSHLSEVWYGNVGSGSPVFCSGPPKQFGRFRSRRLGRLARPEGPDAWYAWCASHAWCALGRWWPWWKSSISTKTSGAENPPKKQKVSGVEGWGRKELKLRFVICFLFILFGSGRI